MKTVGVIGGLSPESTVSYYKGLNEGARLALGDNGKHSAKILLSSVDFGLFCDLKARGEWGLQGQLLADEARGLEAAGADFIILATNTMHKVAHVIEAAISIPFLHIGDATADRILAQGLSRIALLGTQYTMDMDFYKGRLVEKGIDVLVPDEAGRARVSEIIYDELCVGVMSAPSKTFYQSIIEGLAEQGAQGVIFGCTEIGLLLDQGDVSIPVFDTTQIHIDEALALALEP